MNDPNLEDVKTAEAALREMREPLRILLQAAEAVPFLSTGEFFRRSVAALAEDHRKLLRGITDERKYLEEGRKCAAS